MSWYLSWMPRLPLLICLLTILASGDDICMPRLIVLPATAAAADGLPLDDPNTDFVEQNDSWLVERSSPDTWACTGDPALYPQSGCSPASSHLLTGHPESPGGLLNPPLRC